MAAPERAGAQASGQVKTGFPALLFVIISLGLQLLLGTFLGHAYDQRIYMATGYLVATGQDPYIPRDLQAVFHNDAFQGMTSVGYPPPWPLITGAIYFLSYRLFPNLLLYNLALKLPVIAANIALAFLVKALLDRLGAGAAAARRAWLFMLFNPFILVVTAAWGQFDSIVALLALLALICLVEARLPLSAVLLALAVAFKPTALPLLLAAGLFLLGRPAGKIILYFSLTALALILFCAGPFWLFHWDASPILGHWNAQFSVGGGMSFMTFLEWFAPSYQLPGMWWLLGMIWIPALAATALLLKPGGDGFTGLLMKSLLLTLVFFLSRTWLSEPNLILVLPMLVILVSMGKLDSRFLTAFWVLPLLFSLFNTSLSQLLFPSLPGLMDALLRETVAVRVVRMVARTLVVILWLVLEGRLILALLKSGQLRSNLWSNLTGRLNRDLTAD